MKPILVDTCCFIDFLRGSNPNTLPPLILAGRVYLSTVVMLELLAGVRKSETDTLRHLLEGLETSQEFPSLSSTQRMLSRARGRGLLGGLTDIMILAECENIGAHLLSTDTKLVRLAKELKIRVV